MLLLSTHKQITLGDLQKDINFETRIKGPQITKSFFKWILCVDDLPWTQGTGEFWGLLFKVPGIVLSLLGFSHNLTQYSN